MTAVHRMNALKQQAGTILLNKGYEPLIVSDARSSRYSAYDLMAARELGEGIFDAVMVKLKISLHPIASAAEAAVFCRDEIRSTKKFFVHVQGEANPSRFEVWISVPSNRFQTFEITRDGIREILSPGEQAAQQERAA